MIKLKYTVYVCLQSYIYFANNAHKQS